MTKPWKNDPKFSRSLANLTQAFDQLRSFLSLPVQNERDRAGIIQAFEFTFELFWKTFQKAARSEYMEANSPAQSLQAGVQLGFIPGDREQIWVAMAADLLKRIQTQYFSEFEAALKALNA